MAEERLLGQRHWSHVRHHRGERAEGELLRVAATQGVQVALVVHSLQVHGLRVKVWVGGAAMNGTVHNIDAFEHIFVDIIKVDGWKAWLGS